MTDQNPLQAWLLSLTGNIQTTSPEDAANKEALMGHLKVALPSALKLSEARLPSFAFESIHPSTIASLHPDIQSRLSQAAREENFDVSKNEFKVFVRESPVRDVQAGRSMPSWAAGAEVAKTIGPFLNIDGRRLWFDFFRVEKLVALYIQGVANPAILFNINVSRFWTDQNTALLAPAEKHYTLTNDSSIWINSEILAANSPAGKYTGLTIQSGTIEVNELPVIIGNQTFIMPAANVVVKLKLRQQQVTDADPSSVYGTDSRAASYVLPDLLEFEFSGAGSAITAVGNAQSFMFGQAISYQWKNEAVKYSSELLQIAVPLTASETELSINSSASPFAQFSGKAKILSSFWLLPVAGIDLTHISPAAGIGGIGVICNKGLTATWSGLQYAPVNLNVCIVAGFPGALSVASVVAGNLYARQTFTLWQDEKNRHPSTVSIEFGKQFKLAFFSTSNGYELLEANVNATVEADRPIDVSARPLAIRTKDSAFALTAHKNFRTILLYDNNIVADNFKPEPKQEGILFNTISVALQNAVFTTSEVNGCFLTGELGADWKKIQHGILYTALAVYKYIPMLPDPYAANVGAFQKFHDQRVTDTVSIHLPIMILLCQVKWGIRHASEPDNVDVAFHLLPFAFQNAQQHNDAATSTGNTQSGNTDGSDLFRMNDNATYAVSRNKIVWPQVLDNYFKDDCALVDVSSHVNQLGVSFVAFTSSLQRGERKNYTLLSTFGVNTESEQLQSLYRFPYKIDNVQVMLPSLFTRSFLLPQIAWEPVKNLTKPRITGAPGKEGDPPLEMNFYPNDGGATKIFNNSFQHVPLVPKPILKDIIKRFKEDKDNVTISYFTLPFGLKALAAFSKEQQKNPKAPSLELNRPMFKDDLRGGIQLQCNAGKLQYDEFPMFYGTVTQLPNVLNASGAESFSGTLGSSVAFIFNSEFEVHKDHTLVNNRGIPLSRIDFSGYGASMFNNWFNPDAQIAQTSQTKFDVLIGRTAHEVVQVKSLIYPWGIRVVRTIVLYRNNTGYVNRFDTGWQAESDGLFNFNFAVKDGAVVVPSLSHFKIHKGLVKGLFNIKNILEVDEPKVHLTTEIKAGGYSVDDDNKVNKALTDSTKLAVLQKLTLDADIEIEGVVQGHVNGRVAGKGIVGYVQLAPRGVVLGSAALTQLITEAGGSIGGPVNCIVDINGSEQRMRINRIDVSTESSTNTNEVFVAAARGSVILPKDGSWSMVRHTASSGEVAPLPENVTAPLIRYGELTSTNRTNADGLLLGVDVELKGLNEAVNNLVRIANPTEIIRTPAPNTVNYGILHNTGTQKTLFLTPAFKSGEKKLLSKTPPLFSDAYRMVKSKAIFPNIGDAVSDFKDAIALDKSKFAPDSLQDAGATVYHLMDVAYDDKKVPGQAFKMFDAAANVGFKLPTLWKLIDEDAFKIYVEYQTQKKDEPVTPGQLNLNINSFADEAEKWKSKLNNMAMVVDLGPFKRLVTIKGNFNSHKGVESNFGGNGADLPTTEVEFCDELKAVIAILEILQSLNAGQYGDVLKKGMKIAMSNSSGGAWEYKLEASQEIPVVKFPPGILAEDPSTPLKLEASMRLGVYFNAALPVTTDLKKLLPTAGAFVEFYGQIRVACLTIEIATVYAVGQVMLGIAGDTGKGISLHMKFGFGVQLVVGLPVVGNVSVMYMVGVEITLDSEGEVVLAFLMFKGHAELLAGLVCITIMIEAKGGISNRDAVENRTDCIAQVTFAIEISLFLIIDIDFHTSWQEKRQIS